MQIPLTQYWELLAKYLRPQWPRSLALLGLLAASIGLQLANPQVLRTFIDTTTSGQAVARLPLLAVVFIVIALLQQATSVGSTYFGEQVGWTATNALRADLALHCLRLDPAFHKRRSPGELIERIDGDVTALANFFSQLVVQLLGNVALLVGVLIILWTIDWRAALPLTLFAAAVLGLMLRAREFAIPYWTAARQVSARLFGFLEEALAGTEDVRSCGASEYVLGRLYRFTRERFVVGCKARVMGSIPWTIPLALFAVGYTVSFLVIVNLYGAGAITMGTAFVIYYYTQMLFQPLNRISNQADEFQRASAGIVRIRELLQVRAALDDGVGVALPVGPLSVTCRDVTFGYDDQVVIDGLSFRLEPGEVLGLLGRTGSGKTTIARLLARLYDPENGTVLVGEVDLRQARRSDLRRRLGLVTQDVHLFAAPVRDNLTLFDRSIDDRRIRAALDELGLGAWFRRLPRGLDTLLPPGGGLSAGEAQLLAFTRVFLRDPGLVILDEASSRLDPETERLIDRAINRLLDGRTGIIIAHRLATIQRADVVLILEGGRIREWGSRDELARDSRSRFAELLRTGLEGVPA